MKVAQFIYSLGAGGAETLVKELACQLRKQGHEVTILLLDKFKETPYEQKALKHLKDADVSVINLGRSPGSAGIKSFFKLAKSVNIGKFDILHSHLTITDIMAWFMCRYFFKNIRHISTIHNSVIPRRGFIAAIWRYCQRHTTTVFCSQAAMRANAGILGSATFINNGIIASKYEEVKDLGTKTRSMLGIPHNAPIIINVARIAEQKNQLILIKAIQKLRGKVPELQCIICGDGPDRPELEAYIKEHGLTDAVHLLGIREDIPSLLMASDLFVSTSKWEGLPIAVLEAFFAGIFCVLSPIKEHIEIAQGVEGVKIYPQNNVGSLSKTIYPILSSINYDKSELRQKRKEILQPFSMDACADAYLDLYGCLVRNGY